MTCTNSRYRALGRQQAVQPGLPLGPVVRRRTGSQHGLEKIGGVILDFDIGADILADFRRIDVDMDQGPAAGFAVEPARGRR